MNPRFTDEQFRKNQFIWHYYDNKGVHVGIHINSLLPDSTPRKFSPTPFHELSKKEARVTDLAEVVSLENKLFVHKGQKLYPLMPNLPSPNYNDDFGDKKINVRPNLIERAKLNSYANLYSQFLSRRGLSKEELANAIELKQSLVNSRKKKIESAINQVEYEKFVKSIDISERLKQLKNSAKEKNEMLQNDKHEKELQ